jgi:hypothetical protein
MPRRQATVKITGGPQGNDAYVLVCKPNHAQRTPILEEVQSIYNETVKDETKNIDIARAAESEYVIVELLVENGLIVGWNWVEDEAGETPLPPPSTEIVRELLADEVRWLSREAMNVIQAVDLEKKSRRSGSS